MSAYIPLKEIVSNALDEAGKSIRDFDKWWIFGCRGVADIEQSFSGEPKTVRIPVNGNKTVTLPEDYKMWSKIGVLTNEGMVSSLKVNNALTTLKDTQPDRLSKLTPDINDQFRSLAGAPFYYNFYYNGAYNTLFGVGGGMITYGECRVDEKNNVIVLNEDFTFDSIILEYLTILEKDVDLQVQTSLREAVIAFILWKAKLAPAREYYNRCTEARRTLNGKKVTLSIINQVLRESTGFYLKA